MKNLIRELDPKLRVNACTVKDAIIIFEVESKDKKAICPYCGYKSDKVHSIYYKTIADLPIQNKGVYLHITCRKFFCLNDDCSHKFFCESFPFLSKNAKKTTRLIDHIIQNSNSISSLTAVKQLNSNGIKIKKSSICSYLKKNLPEH